MNLREQLALAAFQCTAAYDSVVSNELWRRFSNETIPNRINAFSLEGVGLRYGENPHQKASWYSHNLAGWGAAKQLQGKELSTNNLLDLEAALSTVREFGYEENSENSDFPEPDPLQNLNFQKLKKLEISEISQRPRLKPICLKFQKSAFFRFQKFAPVFLKFPKWHPDF